MYYSQSIHGTSPSRGKQAGANGIIIHTLYGSIRFPAVGHGTVAVTFHTVRKLRSLVKIVYKVNDSETANRTSPGHGEQSGVNSILVHRPYGSVWCPEVGWCTVAVTFHTVRILGNPATIVHKVNDS